MDSLQSSSKVVMNMERITNERDKAHILQLTDYYPYGLQHASARAEGVNRRKFGGKELMSDHGLNSYDFAAGDPIDSTDIKCCIVRKTI